MSIRLRPDQIEVNPAKHQIAKPFLNSFSRKFAQRPNLMNNSIVRVPAELLEYAFSPAYDISGFEILDDESVTLSWRHSKERFNQRGKTNVIDAFTTAYAQLELYNLLDRLQFRCLYHDTDSVIFVHREQDSRPLGRLLR